MYEIVWEKDGLIRRMSGVISVAELDASAREIQDSPHLDDIRYVIHDFSSVSEAPIAADDIEFMAVRAAIALRRNTRVRLACVGTHPVVGQLMDAFNSSGLTPHRIRCFVTLQEARSYACDNGTGTTGAYA